MLQKLIASSLFLASLLLGQEPSAFNAGGSTSPKSESQIINEKLFNLSNRVQVVEESQEGLKSIFEGQIQRIQNLTGKIALVQGESNATSMDIKKHVDSNFALQNENIDKLKNSISALGALIQKTNTQMQNEIDALKGQIAALEKNNSVKESQVGRSTPKEALKEASEDSKEVATTNAKINAVIANLESNSTQVKPLETENIQENNATKAQNSEISVKEQKPKSEQIQKDTKETKPQENKESKTDLKNKRLSEVFKEGEEFVKSKDYESAEEYLQFAIKGNYKPARGNYLLGEVAFAQKRYEDAIYYYKTSATRYDKADYMPRLMLNSAKSFNAIKEKENAKRFLETLISLYPNSSEAKEAKKLLK